MRLMRISITMILWLTIFSAPLFSQQTKDLNPPTNLTYEVIDEHDVQLIWNQPSSGDGDWIHWDSGENADAFGFMMGAEHFAVASKWNPEHLEAYDSWTITKMRFFLTSDQPTVTLKFWTGENATEIYSQVITDFNTNDWTEITLDTPITIDASTQLWAGLDIDMPVGAGVMGMDAGPGLNGYGDMLRYQGNWYTGADLGIDNNWNIQIEIENASKSTTDLLGYNLYKNDVVLNSNPITSTSYLDQDLINGTYNYYVTAVYDEGESTASNTVEVIVNQDVINVADSLALVELYQTCNGENWTHNDNWLTGPLSSWDGVTTNNNRVEELFLSANNVSGDIPESFGDLTGLVDFLATTNEITSIPSTFGNLESLEVCWIGWNPISSLPDNFGNLNNLVELHIGYTELQTLPSSFGNLTNLKWLAIRDSQLSGLPDNFGNLSSLRTCFAAVNQIEELPASFHL
ncbi:MAG: hypothetical protein KAH25_06845, partial [Bacteroidales bacterium]|nr:hypothetical protein [Bacteroidales bacterium]